MQGYDLEITVLGDPKAQGRPRAARIGKYVHVYDDPQSRSAKSNLISAVYKKAPDKPLDCPLQVDVNFYFQRPRSHYGSGKNASKLKASAPLLHTSRPDIDNLKKLVMDAMTGIFWRDDALICISTTTKQYSDKPRTEIFIRKLKEDD
jgi:Holliday junction resolvase RusA-like endonuclease